MTDNLRNEIKDWIADVFFDGRGKIAQKFITNFTMADMDKSNKKLGEGVFRRYIDFKNARYELLRICYQVKNPKMRWKRYKKYMISNLNNLRLDFQKEKNLKPAQYISRVLKDRSFTSELINFVACCNALSSKPAIKLPQDVELYGTEKDLRFWVYRRNIANIVVLYNDGELKFYDIPLNEYNKYETNYYLFKSGSKINLISQHEFCLEFNKRHPELVRTYKITKSMKPFDILNRTFKSQLHKECLNDILGSTGDWEIEKSYPDVDIHEVLRKYDPSRSTDDVSRFYCDKKPIWEPDDFLIDYDALRFNLIDTYLRNFNIIEREAILLRLLQGFDFDLFELKAFREIFSLWKFNKAYENIRQFIEVINNKYSQTKSKISETEKTYWKIYLDVENLVSNYKYSKQEACRKLEDNYELVYQTIWTRYKEKQSIVRKNNLTDQDIIQASGLYQYEKPLMLRDL